VSSTPLQSIGLADHPSPGRTLVEFLEHSGHVHRLALENDQYPNHYAYELAALRGEGSS